MQANASVRFPVIIASSQLDGIRSPYYAVERQRGRGQTAQPSGRCSGLPRREAFGTVKAAVLSGGLMTDTKKSGRDEGGIAW